MAQSDHLSFTRLRPFLALLAFLVTTVAATVATAADQAPTIDTGDTAWVLTASAMVLLLTPGLAFFYGGLVRRKNILSVLMQCFVILKALDAVMGLRVREHKELVGRAQVLQQYAKRWY